MKMNIHAFTGFSIIFFNHTSIYTLPKSVRIFQHKQVSTVLHLKGILSTYVGSSLHWPRHRSSRRNSSHKSRPRNPDDSEDTGLWLDRSFWAERGPGYRDIGKAGRNPLACWGGQSSHWHTWRVVETKVGNSTCRKTDLWRNRFDSKFDQKCSALSRQQKRTSGVSMGLMWM